MPLLIVLRVRVSKKAEWEEYNISLQKAKKARINRLITAREIRLIGEKGEQLGVVSNTEAFVKAEEAGLDLVEISPTAAPPVCRIMDYGKYLFEQGKRQKQKSKKVHLKELKVRPVTDVGDYQVKLRNAIRFLEHGDKVKLTLRFRGREMAHQDLGRSILRRFEADLQEYGSVEQEPRLEGRQVVMIVGPGKKK